MNSDTTSTPSPSRRDVLATLSACTACAAIGFCGEEAAAAAPGVVDLGEIADFAEPGIYDQFAKPHKLMLIRSAERLIAVSNMCTHKRCALKKKEDHLRCPCHGSTFDTEGYVLDGQAKSSLPRFAIQIENGRVKVDASKVFEERQWDDPAASVTIAKDDKAT